MPLVYDLTGKTAIVTGASRGIGKETALMLAKAGANVVINYNRSEEEAIKLKEELESLNVKALTVKADVAVFKEAESLVAAAIDHFKRIDILINNAGITRDNLLARMKADEWSEVIETNLTGVYNCTRALIRPLLKQKSGGRIINVSSVAGISGNSGQSNYAAAKGGVIAFTRSLAKELGSRKITVNAVAPGFIDTEMTDILTDEVKAGVLQRIALGRLGRPADVAEVILFLAASASYVTGQVIAVDGSLAL